MLEVADGIVVDCVKDPKVDPVPKEEDPEAEEYDADFKRDPDKLYVDEVMMDDKFFIFAYVTTGAKDLEPFRQQQDRDVEALSNGQDDRSAAIDAAGSR
jgi:hypothetical protein